MLPELARAFTSPWNIPVAAVVFAVAVLVRSQNPGAGFAETVALVLVSPTLVSFTLAPVWLVRSVIVIRRAATLEQRLRYGSRSDWLVGQTRIALAEALPLAVAVAIAAFSAAAGSAPEPDWLTVRPQLTIDGGMVDLALTPAAFALLAWCALLAAAVLARIVLAAAAVVRPTFPVLGGVAAVVFVAGGFLGSGQPLPGWLRLLLWTTWLSPAAAGAESGRPLAGPVVLCALIALVIAGVMVGDLGPRAAWARLSGRPLVLLGLVLAVTSAVLLNAAVGTAVTGGVDAATAFAYLLQGAPLRPGRLAVAPLILSLIGCLTVPYLMVARLESERNGWLPLVLIRSGSPGRWVAGFLARQSSRALAALGILAAAVVIGWMTVPGASVGSDTPRDDVALIAIRFGAIGALQAVFFVLVVFLAVVLAGSAAGLATIAALLVSGTANGVLGGLAPSLLGSLSRNEAGPAGLGRDAVVLLAWTAAVVAGIAVVTLRRGGTRQRVRTAASVMTRARGE
ncbi:MAG: hypothetical protein QM635_05300 [Microbacteriaceae bacterium]